MRRPTKAILLSAGFGTRMRPISWAVPKPLIPLWNRPLALRLLEMLAGWGVREVLVNLHHGADAVFNSLREAVASERMPLQLVFSFEADILGTGGALRRASWFLDDNPFWLVNSDIAADVRPEPFLREMARHRPLSVLWLDSRIGPRTVETRNGRIATFRSANPGAPGTATFCGLHLLSPDILRFLPDRPFSSVIEAYDNAMKAGRQVRGVEVARSFWRDLGTPAQYLEAHATWAVWQAQGRNEKECGRRLTKTFGTESDPPGSGKTVLSLAPEGQPLLLPRRSSAPEAGRPPSSPQFQIPFCAVAPSAVIAPGAHIENSVIMDGARVSSGVRLRNAIVGPGAIVTRSTEGPVVRADLPASDAPPYARVAASLGWNETKTAVNALAPRGSDRSFSRIVCGRRSAILIEYGTLRPENAAYAGIARFLAGHGVRVPAILLDWPDAHILVMEDAGDRALESMVPNSSKSRIEAVYRDVLDSVVRLHGIPVTATRTIRDHLQPAFGPTVYRWERELFAHHFLGPRLGIDSRGQAAVLSELARVGRHLASAPPVLVHRDLQSSNVYLGRGMPVLIDFQGMRFGPAAYDVASLLCDPYVMLPDDIRDRLLTYYLERVPDPEHVQRLFWWAAIERLSQALGAFGRLSESPDTTRFANYIPPALAMMRRALRETPELKHLSATVAKAVRTFPNR
jgi:NDP-sugar pyrophosphorylase family protein